VRDVWERRDLGTIHVDAQGGGGNTTWSISHLPPHDSVLLVFTPIL
jgi:hypothetical protein